MLIREIEITSALVLLCMNDISVDRGLEMESMGYRMTSVVEMYVDVSGRDVRMTSVVEMEE